MCGARFPYHDRDAPLSMKTPVPFPVCRGLLHCFSLYVFLAVCCPLTACTPPSRNEDPSPSEARKTLDATARVSYSTPLQAYIADYAARSLALLDVLDQGADAVGTLTAVRFSLGERTELSALAEAALPVLLYTFDDQFARSVTASANMFIPTGALGGMVQEAMGKTDELELKVEALRAMAPLAREVKTLLEQAVALSDLDIKEVSLDSWMANINLAARSGKLEAWYRYLQALEQFGSSWSDAAGAYAILQRLEHLDQDNALIRLALAEVLLRLDRPHEAMGCVNDALGLKPGLARAFYLRGIIQLRLGLTALAVTDFSQALRLRPDRADWWRARGAALMIRHDYDAMCRDLYKACSLGDCAGLTEARQQEFCLEPEK